MHKIWNYNFGEEEVITKIRKLFIISRDKFSKLMLCYQKSRKDISVNVHLIFLQYKLSCIFQNSVQNSLEMGWAYRSDKLKLRRTFT